jgi:integrase
VSLQVAARKVRNSCATWPASASARSSRPSPPAWALRYPAPPRPAPHQLRHAHAVELAREGVPLNVIQRQLGHANLGTTSILYITLLCAGDERPPSRPALTAAPLLAA